MNSPRFRRARHGNDLELGFIAGQRRKLGLSDEARKHHLYISGASRAGKSKFLEHLICQDILTNRRSGCGMLVIDPHGSLYDAVMDWLARTPHLTTGRFARPIVPIDLTDAEHVVGYNVLRPRAAGVDPHVIAEEMRKAIVHAWGAHGTDQTPLLERWLDNALMPLIETGRTLPEAWWLVHDHPFREEILRHVRDPIVRAQWERARELSARDYDAQVLSTVNRLTRFVRNAALRRMLGQTAGLDWDKAQAEGSIIIVSAEDMRRFNAHFGQSRYESESQSSGSFSSESEGVSEFPMLMPQMGREESARQYRSLEEQLHLAMVALQDQDQRQFVAQIAGLREPVSVFTPEMSERQPKPEQREHMMQRLRARWPFIVTTAIVRRLR